MNLLIGDRVSVEHFPEFRVMVLYFQFANARWAETFSDWDWHGMRRAIRRNAVDEEEMHLELIELARLERSLQTKRKPDSLWRGIPLAMLGMGAVVFWVLSGVGVVKLLGW